MRLVPRRTEPTRTVGDLAALVFQEKTEGTLADNLSNEL